jgi:hypothetical protein
VDLEIFAQGHEIDLHGMSAVRSVEPRIYNVNFLSFSPVAGSRRHR